MAIDVSIPFSTPRTTIAAMATNVIKVLLQSKILNIIGILPFNRIITRQQVQLYR